MQKYNKKLSDIMIDINNKLDLLNGNHKMVYIKNKNIKNKDLNKSVNHKLYSIINN